MRKQTIEYGGEAVGALMPDNGRLRFIAVKYSVWPLEGRTFEKPEEAVRAIAALHSLRHRQPILRAGTPPAGRIAEMGLPSDIAVPSVFSGAQRQL